jgi:hypothetical protein
LGAHGDPPRFRLLESVDAHVASIPADS